MEAQLQILRFTEIMQKKNISVYDINLSTGLPINIINHIIDNGDGTIEDINKIIGCLKVRIQDCISEDDVVINNNTNANIKIIELFKQKAMINFFSPEEVQLVKSFKGEKQKRYLIRTYPLSDINEENNQDIPEKLRRMKVIQTSCWKTPEEAKKEFLDQIAPKLDQVKHLYPDFTTLEPEEIEYGTLELLLEYYHLSFNPFENNKIIKVGRVYPYGTLKNYNEEYMRKFYAICGKPKMNSMKSLIYSQEDLDSGKIHEHIKLMNFYDLPTIQQGVSIIEFLVPSKFYYKNYYLETNTIFPEIDRLKFNVIETEK
jgi:hypothetical protein